MLSRLVVWTSAELESAVHFKMPDLFRTYFSGDLDLDIVVLMGG